MAGPSFPHAAEARQLMGTRWEVVLPGTDRPRLVAAAEAALDEVERLEAQLSRFRDDSEIAGLNHHAAEGPVLVEPRLFRLLQLAREVWEGSGGAFDPTVGPLVEAWGLGGGGAGRVPSPEEREAARARCGLEHLVLDEDGFTVRFAVPGMSLDLGAIGKGYAIDRAVEVLEEAGVDNALLHAGTSTVYGMGGGPTGQGWAIALRDPREPEREEVLRTIVLRDRALSVSGPHNQSFQVGERRYGHVLDPRTGEPAESALLAAASHPSAALTDAVSTALLVLGAEGMERLAARWPGIALLVLGADGKCRSVGGWDGTATG